MVRVLIPPTAARPHSVDFLLCGHHFRTSVGALAVAGAVIINDRRSGRTTTSEQETGHPAPSGITPRR